MNLSSQTGKDEVLMTQIRGNAAIVTEWIIVLFEGIIRMGLLEKSSDVLSKEAYVR